MAPSRPAAHITPAVQRLLDKFTQLSLHHRALVRGAYRVARRLATSEQLTEARLHAAAQTLRAQAAQGGYANIALGVKLAQVHCRFIHAGPANRALRHQAREAFHLLRFELQSLLGMRPPVSHPTVSFGHRPASPDGVVWTDASVRGNRGAAGIWMLDANGSPALSRALHLVAKNAIDAELQAALSGLRALLDAGAVHAQLNTDSQAVFRAFEGRLRISYCVEEAQLLELAARFRSLEIRLVPRALNSEADRLAGSLTSTSSYVDAASVSL